VCKKEDLYIQIKFMCRVHRGWAQECYDWPTTNDYKQGSIIMTFKAPDLPLRLPYRHFSCAYLYSLPRPALLSRTVFWVHALICSPCRFMHVVVMYSCSFNGGPSERCCGVWSCLRTGRGCVFGVWVVA
jgi:hypothetical protein